MTREVKINLSQTDEATKIEFIPPLSRRLARTLVLSCVEQPEEDYIEESLRSLTFSTDSQRGQELGEIIRDELSHFGYDVNLL